MLRRFSKWKSQGNLDISGAKVLRGGMPRLLGTTGSGSTSWFRMALVMWLTMEGKLFVELSVPCRSAETDESDCDK